MRVTPASAEEIPWYVRPIFWAQKRRYGTMLTSALVWARSPKPFFGLSVLYGMIDRKGSPIEAALRSLITVRVSQINHCAFCIDINSVTLLERGVSQEKLDTLSAWYDSKLFSAKERAALQYAEAMTITDREVDDAVFRQISEHFDEQAIVELTGLVAFQNMSSKFNSALMISPMGFCALPDIPGEKKEI